MQQSLLELDGVRVDEVNLVVDVPPCGRSVRRAKT
jgi:hypothetical protein